MKNATSVTISAGALKKMTPQQFTALQENILADGMWETAYGCRITIGMSQEICVEPIDGHGKAMIFIGIERDGYTHS